MGNRLRFTLLQEATPSSCACKGGVDSTLTAASSHNLYDRTLVLRGERWHRHQSSNTCHPFPQLYRWKRRTDKVRRHISFLLR